MIIIKDGEVKAREGVLKPTSQVVALKVNVLQLLQIGVSLISVFISLNEWVNERVRESWPGNWEQGPAVW